MNLTILRGVLVGSVLASACGGSSPTAPTTVSALTVTGASSFSARNETAQFVASVRLSTGVQQDQTLAATWESSRPDVASVSATGVVTALTSGTADITATFQGVTGRRTTGVSIVCEIDHTATVVFGNVSAIFTFDLVWNGAVLVPGLAPLQTSAQYAVAAGVPHTFQFRLANSTREACRQTTAILAQCSTQTITCGTPLP